MDMQNVSLLVYSTPLTFTCVIVLHQIESWVAVTFIGTHPVPAYHRTSTICQLSAFIYI